MNLNVCFLIVFLSLTFQSVAQIDISEINDSQHEGLQQQKRLIKGIREKTSPLVLQKELTQLKANYKRSNLMFAVFLTLLLLGTFLFYIFSLNQKRKISALIQEKAALERLRAFEKKALSRQMNPHFIFNCLNSIKSYIVKKEPRIAAKYLTKFAQHMRLILCNSQKQFIPISDELRALEIYIELEQFRLSNKFYTNILIDPKLNIEQLLIPPLIIQPYVEEVILFGFAKKESKNSLEILIGKKQEQITVEIYNNGKQIPETKPLIINIIKEGFRFHKLIDNVTEDKFFDQTSTIERASTTSTKRGSAQKISAEV